MRLASCWWTILCLQILQGVLVGFWSSHITTECTLHCPSNCVTTEPVELDIQSHPSHSLSDWESLLGEAQSSGQQAVVLHASCRGHLAWGYEQGCRTSLLIYSFQLFPLADLSVYWMWMPTGMSKIATVDSRTFSHTAAEVIEPRSQKTE